MTSSGSLIREARLRAGLSQGALGERVGRDRAQIARWERGGNTPSYETLRLLVAACELELEVGVRRRDALSDATVAVTRSMTPRERLGRVLHGGEAGDPIAPLKALEAAGVRQVLIGALARTLRGTDESWLAVEICPDMNPPNAALLESVLSQLPAGAVHVCATPTGSGGYDDLTRAATAEAIAALTGPRSSVHLLCERVVGR